MHPRFSLPIALAALLLAPAVAFAQPTLYVCTPTAQVLAVNGSTLAPGSYSVLFNGTGTFHDCVVGPDGWLYIANDNNILRLDPLDPAQNNFLSASGLNFTPKGLAFNVTTLYMTSGGSGNSSDVYRWVGGSTPDTNPSTFDGTLTFAGSPTKFNGISLGVPGRGVVFDVVGNMILASDSRLDSAAPPYGSASTLIGSGITAVGVAVNTCKDVVYADFAAGTVKTAGGTTLATFSGNDKPLYIEVDSSNVMYAVTATKIDGSGAKIWRVPFTFATTGCSAATPQLLLELKNSLPGLNSAGATGIAVAATNNALTNATPYSASHCSDEYDFGYHRVTLEFTDCANTFAGGATASVQVEALKTTLSQTTFKTDDPSFANTPTPIEGMRYSAMGGFVVQYDITTASSPAPGPVRLIYHFDTQEFIVAPGVAKATGTDPALFNDNVGTDYWEAGKLDPPAGERGDTCCSKHVVYNAGAANAQCTFSFDEPLKSQNPLFNGSQTISVSGTARNGGFKCDGGVLRLSIFRVVFPDTNPPIPLAQRTCPNREAFEGTSPVFMFVTSAGGAQEDNIMDAAGQGKYKFNLDSSSYETGVHVLTIAGPVNTAPNTIGSLNIPSATKCIQYQK